MPRRVGSPKTSASLPRYLPSLSYAVSTALTLSQRACPEKAKECHNAPNLFGDLAGTARARPALRNPAPVGMQQAPVRQPHTGRRRRPAVAAEGSIMIKVRTFTTPIKIFATQRELLELDDHVSAFLNEESATMVYSCLLYTSPS